MALANVSILDTFDTWRVRTNQIIYLADEANTAASLANASVRSAFDKANSANVLAYDTGIGANAFTSATIAGANTAVGAGANAFTSATIAGANTAVGTGANTYLLATIAGANSAVGTGANTYLLATLAGANTAVGAGANTVGAAAFAKANTTATATTAAFAKANGAAQLAFVTITANGTNLVADSNNDTLTIEATSNVTIVGVAGTDTMTFDLGTTGASAGIYGGTTAIPVVTVDDRGRVKSISNTSITAGATVEDQTTSASTFYPVITTTTTGSLTTANVSTTKLSFVPSTGTLSSTVFSATSDIKQKTDIRNIHNALSMVEAMYGVGFKWKDTGEKSYGVIAQDIESLLPEVVSENEEGVKSVNYSAIIPFLIEAIKELNRKIEGR